MGPPPACSLGYHALRRLAHLIHLVGGVHGAHLALLLVLIDDWPCGLQVGLDPETGGRNMWMQIQQFICYTKADPDIELLYADIRLLS